MAQAAIPLAATAFSVAGKVQAGRAAKKAADSEAKQIDANAKRARLAGKTQAEEEQRETARLMSDMSASQAGSGFAASDAAALRQVGQAAGVGKYNELSILYQSELDAKGMDRAASNKRKSGRAARKNAYFSAAATAFAGISSSMQGKPPADVSTSSPSWSSGTTSYAAPRPAGITRRTI